jgi:hypothetical protein
MIRVICGSSNVKNLPSILACFILAGCATAPTFPAPNADWKSFTGQLQYVTPARSIIGEFTATRHGDEFRLEFSKGGAMTLLRLARHGDLILAEGPLARGRWHGRAEAAPAYLRGWTAVPGAFASVAREPDAPHDGIETELVLDHNKPKSLSFRGAQTGEKFIFQFNR